MTVNGSICNHSCMDVVFWVTGGARFSVENMTYQTVVACI